MSFKICPCEHQLSSQFSCSGPKPNTIFFFLFFFFGGGTPDVLLPYIGFGCSGITKPKIPAAECQPLAWSVCWTLCVRGKHLPTQGGSQQFSWVLLKHCGDITCSRVQWIVPFVLLILLISVQNPLSDPSFCQFWSFRAGHSHCNARWSWQLLEERPHHTARKTGLGGPSRRTGVDAPWFPEQHWQSYVQSSVLYSLFHLVLDPILSALTKIFLPYCWTKQGGVMSSLTGP